MRFISSDHLCFQCFSHYMQNLGVMPSLSPYCLTRERFTTGLIITVRTLSHVLTKLSLFVLKSGLPRRYQDVNLI